MGTLPWDAAPLGAPGCELLVSVDRTVFRPVDGNGEAAVTFPVPVDPVFGGLKIYAQSASSSTANGLGLASSDALQIRMR